MKTKFPVLIFFVFVFSGLADAQTVYYCFKSGKKIVTDQPCSNLGATEQKRLTDQDMPPLNTSQGLSDDQRRQSQEIDQRNQRQNVIDEEKSKLQHARQARDQADNQKVCNDLDSYKKSIIDQQRAMNSEYLNAEHRRVNDEIYRRNCQTL